jgi:protein TonB
MAEIFGQSFVDAAGKTNKNWTVAVSFIGQMIAVGASILVPLVFAGVLPKAQLISMLTAPSSPAAPPPPAPVEKVVTKRVPRQFLGDVLLAPNTIPKQVAAIVEGPLIEGPSGDAVVTLSAVPGVMSQGVPAGLVNTPPPPPPLVSARTEVAATPRRIVVSGGVQGARLIKKPTPSYPPLARQARVQGTVKFTAIIGKDGAIHSLTLVSGHPLLVQAAQDVVKQWLYQPTLLNGEPVEVVTEIDVNFALSNN